MRFDYEEKHPLCIQYQNTLDFRMHAQSSLEFGIIEEGTCVFICSGNQYTLKKGDIFIAFPNQPHTYINSQNLKTYLLLVPVKSYLPEFYNLLTKQTPKKAVLSANEWDESILPILKYAYNDVKTASASVMRGYLQVIWGKIMSSLVLLEHQSNTKDALYKILYYINQNYKEQITRSDIAKNVGYNESYISHLFSAIMHTTIPDYLHTLRTEDACNMLCSTALSVSQISAELGFTSIRNFNRIFLSKTGMTPRQYRRQSQK